MTAALEDLGLPRPSEKALRDLRRRLGPAPVKAAVRDGRGPAGAAVDPGRDLPGAADGGVRRPELGQGARQRPEPVLAGEDDDPPGPGRVPGDADRGAGRDRHPRAARRGDRRQGRAQRGAAGPQAGPAAARGDAAAGRPGL